MKPRQIVVDTNVFVAALRSQHGASYKLFMLLEGGKFQFNLSVPLAIEYEAAGKRLVRKKSRLKARDIDDILDYVFSVANRRKVYYLWRPFLGDPKDDMVPKIWPCRPVAKSSSHTTKMILQVLSSLESES